MERPSRSEISIIVLGVVLSLGFACARTAWRSFNPAGAVYYSIGDGSLTTTTSPLGVVEGRPNHPDPWGNPFRGKVSSSEPGFFYSAGPNGIDEDGRGDDIRFLDDNGRVRKAFWNDRGRAAYRWLSPSFSFAPLALALFVVLVTRFRRAGQERQLGPRVLVLLTLLSLGVAAALSPIVVKVWEEVLLEPGDSALPFPAPPALSFTLTLAALFLVLACCAYSIPRSDEREETDP